MPLLTPGLLERAVTHLRMRPVRVVGDETSFGLAAALLRSMAASTAVGALFNSVTKSRAILKTLNIASEAVIECCPGDSHLVELAEAILASHPTAGRRPSSTSDACSRARASIRDAAHQGLLGARKNRT
jgi:hypothetical protein